MGIVGSLKSEDTDGEVFGPPLSPCWLSSPSPCLFAQNLQSKILRSGLHILLPQRERCTGLHVECCSSSIDNCWYLIGTVEVFWFL